tara:strand:- start:5371 stop:6225 length:855 start_codon:yes stop_codon:yes gene_type:complete
MQNKVKIIECPRDAMQGIVEYIPVDVKIKYINELLKVGFDTIDFGSFVSHKAIPQLRDTEQVLDGLDLGGKSSKLLAIVANKRGAEKACGFNEIDYLGFPLSVSEEFQKRNTNKSISEALLEVKEMQNLSLKNNKQLVVYLSMSFGNPYQEYYHSDIVAELVSKLNAIGVDIISLSDTIGVSNKENIAIIFSTLISEFNHIEFGAHFHTKADESQEKLEAAFVQGCRRFDTTIMGYGGCPMAKDVLVGNMPTEHLITFLHKKGLKTYIDESVVQNIVKNMLLYF